MGKERKNSHMRTHLTPITMTATQSRPERGLAGVWGPGASGHRCGPANAAAAVKGREEAPQELRTNYHVTQQLHLWGRAPQSECRQILYHLSHQGSPNPLPWDIPREVESAARAGVCTPRSAAW